MADVTFTLGADASNFHATLASIDRQLEAMARKHKKLNITGFELGPTPAMSAQAWRKVNPLAGIQPMASQTWTDYLDMPPPLPKGGKTASAIAGAEQRRLLMPFLSIMFAAMAAQRALQSLVDPAMKLTGIFDIINSMLELFFLPIMLWLLDPLFWLFDIVTSLDENAQMLVGAFVLLGIIFSGFAVILAQVVLGLSGFSALLSMLAPAGAGAGGAGAAAGGGLLFGLSGGTILILLALIAVALAVILVVIGIIIIAWDRFSKLIGDVYTLIKDFVVGAFNAIMDVIVGFVRIIIGVGWIILGVFEMIVGALTGNEDLMTKGWQLFVDGLGQIFTGILQIISGVITLITLYIWTLITWIGTVVGGIYEIIFTAFSRVITWFVDNFMPDMKKPWTEFSIFLSDLWSGLKDTIMGFMQPILDGLKTITEGAKNLSGGGGGGNWLPWFAEGGPVTSTGLGMLHAGEYVVPRGGMLVSESGGSNTVNVYANVASDVDINILANQIARIWHSDFNRRMG